MTIFLSNMSSFTPIIKGLVKDSKLVLSKEEKEIFSKLLLGLNKKQVDIIIKESKNKRSLRQNSYYWGVVIKIISDYSGNTPEETSQFFKNKFLKAEREMFGEPYIYLLGTSELKTHEFEDYIEKIRTFALTCPAIQLNIPKPEKVLPKDNTIIDDRY